MSEEERLPEEPWRRVSMSESLRGRRSRMSGSLSGRRSEEMTQLNTSFPQGSVVSFESQRG